jgi:2-polyprenyl-3-methyl-5-hydroxy-6-metoxy-1,4-benzoquinol methylase
MTRISAKKTDDWTRSCEACGSRSLGVLLNNLSHVYGSSGKSQCWYYRLLECQSCGLGFVDPKPTWELLQTFYDESYGNYDGLSPTMRQEPYSIKYRIAKLRMASFGSNGVVAITKRSIGILAEWITGRTISFSFGIPFQLSKDAYIFDLGYGTGNWLLAMSDLGFSNLHGYDIDANSQNISKLSAKGIKISGGIFLENNYPEEIFDCIRLDHVFEHLLEPIEVLAKCRRMLRPGGFLVMSFPCKDSWSMRVSLLDSPALQLPKHLYHHTQMSARLMINTAGFVLSKSTAYSVASQFGETVNGLLVKQNRRIIPPKLISLLAPVYRALGRITGKGDFITLWAKKSL